MTASNFGLHIHLDDGTSRPATAAEIIAAARLALDQKFVRLATFDCPSAAKDYACLRLGQLEHEVFCVFFLDAQHRLIEFREMFRGTLTQTSVYPREVVKAALELNAAALILVHPHPSGVPTPSRADEALTSALQGALNLIDVRVLDHLVIAGGKAVSMAEMGLM